MISLLNFIIYAVGLVTILFVILGIIAGMWEAR